MYVVKRDGRREPVLFDKITSRIRKLCYGLSNHVEPIAVSQKVCLGVYKGVTTSELDELAAETSAQLTTDHPDYGLLAARIAVSNLHKSTDKSFSRTAKKLREYVEPKTGKPAPLLSEATYSIIEEHSARLDSAIIYARDYTYDYFGFKTLERGYLLKIDGRIVERPQQMLMRVALGIHGQDVDAAIETYNLMSEKYFTHASPTLFNAGTPRPQLSSCFLLQMKDDSIEGIYDTLKRTAMISKNAGGIGLAAHKIRATGSYVRGTNGTSNGLVPMLRVFNNTARYVDQGGGKRKGAFAIYLEPWHADVFEFLDLKKNHGAEEHRARDLFYAMWIPDLFMRRVEADGDWTLMCPNESPGLARVHSEEFDALYERYEREGKFRKVIKARALWQAILESQTETGTPYILYKDACNAKSNQQNLGTIQCSNLCTEIIQYTSPEEVAVCNLASIALPQFVVRGVGDDDSVAEDGKANNGSAAASPAAASGGRKPTNASVAASAKRRRLRRERSIRLRRQRSGTFSPSSSSPLSSSAGGMSTPPSSGSSPSHSDDESAKPAAEEKRSGDDIENDNEEEEEVVDHGKPFFDHAKLYEIVRVVTRNLNRIIDVNFYPLEEARSSNMRHRPIGIGVQGLADTFMKMRLPFDSPEAAQLNREIFETMYFAALSASVDLAKEDGPYESYPGSPFSKGILQFDMWKKDTVHLSGRWDWDSLKRRLREHGARNSLLMAPMPTASTSQILGNNECFEPYTSNMYVRRTLAGEFVVVNPFLLRDLIRLGLWTPTMKNRLVAHNGSVQNLPGIPDDIKRLYKTVWEIKGKVMIDMAAERGVFIDQSQSFNVHMTNVNFGKLTSMHFYAWKRGLKTGMYYLRSKAATDAIKFTVDTAVLKEEAEAKAKLRKEKQVGRGVQIAQKKVAVAAAQQLRQEPKVEVEEVEEQKEGSSADEQEEEEMAVPLAAVKKDEQLDEDDEEAQAKLAAWRAEREKQKEAMLCSLNNKEACVSCGS